LDVTIGLAFLAGLASFLSPCVFPLVPAYIGYLGGRTIIHEGESFTPRQRWSTVAHGFTFILGFSIIFILLGLTFSILGSWLYNIRWLLAKIGGIVVVLFGIHMTGIIRFRFLEYDLRYQTPTKEKVGYLASFLMGVFFSAGWSPCLGPVLASILTIAMNSGDTWRGVSLLGAYSIGLGIPFLLAAFGVSWVSKILVRFKKALRIIEIIMGIILIIVGIMLFTGTFAIIAKYGNFFNMGL
jgi:cytochrome c-type biogenesis protein